MKSIFKSSKILLKTLEVLLPLVILFALVSSFFLFSEIKKSQAKENDTESKLVSIKKSLEKTTADFTTLKNTDQVTRNNKLEQENKNINATYKEAVKTYEDLLKLKETSTKTAPLDDTFTKILTLLSDRNYASAEAQLKTLNADIQKQQAAVAASFSVPKNVKQDNSAPGNGYQRQLVHTERGDYMVDIIAADLNSTKVIVDTASDSDCANDCPVMALGDFASRSGAFAAVNGQYFCPSTYPSCAGKTNSFDTLLMNKNKVYFNSANNVYSSNPAAVFGAGYSRFMGHASEWGRDTGVDAVVSNYPLLVSNGNIAINDSVDAQQSGKGNRAFIGGSGSTAYIGVIYNANVTDMAYVLKTMGIQNGLNLDSGGSLALWSNGRYIAGPGRGLPFGILFVRR
jgi:exopolysaccharide biosynthesis protein